MYHCHVQSHSDMGMVGLFLVKKPDGTIPGYDPHEHAHTAASGSSPGTRTDGRPAAARALSPPGPSGLSFRPTAR